MSVESKISCNGIVVIGKPISQLSSSELSIASDDFLVISKKVTDESGNTKYNSYKYNFQEFDGNYVHKTGDENIDGVKYFQNIDSNNVAIGNGEDALTIRGGNSFIHGNISSDASISSSGILTNESEGTIVNKGKIEIEGNVEFKNDSFQTVVMSDSGNITIKNLENEIRIQREDSDGQKNILNIKTNQNNNDTTLSIGTDGTLGYRVYPYVVNPGRMVEVSALDRIASTKYVHDNYVNVPKYTYDYNILSSKESEHDKDTVHKTKEETIVGTKYFDSASLYMEVSSNGQFNNVFGFKDAVSKSTIGYISEKTENDSFNKNTLRIQCNPKTGDKAYNAYIEISVDNNRNGRRIIQNIEPQCQYGQDLATTKWTRDQMIELSDQTHDYIDIVNAPNKNDVDIQYDKAKLSPSVTAVKEFNRDYIVPQTNNILSNFLSNYLAYDYNNDGDAEEGKKIHLDKMRLVKFQAFYEHKNADPVEFYVLTPLSSNI